MSDNLPLSAIWLDADGVGRMLSLSGRVVRERVAREHNARVAELEAERDALHAALIAVTKEPQGCRFCHAGRLITPNNPEKGHDAGCGFLLAARALLNKTADAAAIDS